MKYRNPTFTASGAIDCEIEHPQFGWVQFTASADDPEEHGRLIFAEVKDSATPYAPIPPDPEALKETYRQSRAAAYATEADPLFFKWQAGEATKAEWEAKRAEIRQRFPYPEE